MKKRKLIIISTLRQLQFLTDQGVPLARAMRKAGIGEELTRPTAYKLLQAFKDPNNYNSLFPDWLDPLGSCVQEQPDNYEYIGYFPKGYWACKTSDHSLI